MVGRVDHYDVENRALVDYKTVKGYFVKKLRKDGWSSTAYDDQLNLYRAIGYPEAKTLWLEVVVKDWSPSMQKKDDIHAFERIRVPIYDPNVVLKKAVKKIEDSMESHVRDCTEEETWGMVRCERYCEVGIAGECPQLTGI